MVRIPLILCLGVLISLAAGCSHNPTHDQLAKIYRTGMTRDEAAQTLGKRTEVQVRPATGWPVSPPGDKFIASDAGDFERRENTIVQTCEVYWVPRGFMEFGAWWNYLFYGPDDRLLGFRRKFVD